MYEVVVDLIIKDNYFFGDECYDDGFVIDEFDFGFLDGGDVFLNL